MCRRKRRDPLAVHDHRETSPQKVLFGIVTVSDSRTHETDSSGTIIEKLVSAAGHSVAVRSIVKDDGREILSALTASIDGGAEAVVFTGGTGITSRDVTYETLRPLMEKLLDGFGELFRYLSYMKIGSAAIMSRAFAGVIKGKIVFCLPGSPEAVSLAMEAIILPEIGHIIREIRR
ncbi:MAG: molybdenum cofactor biosynthesis protein MoaB [Candidatus Thermoplasmatota archaeon]|nr:molybdenum cofactor biosynthesis protein MoaB [Candidatus Thermoplasmatota archaeon]MCL5253110.1 molybdenum cofactor biosynthesis protein MoaB [Candidatus Thermoplasmatota archaeon]